MSNSLKLAQRYYSRDQFCSSALLSEFLLHAGEHEMESALLLADSLYQLGEYGRAEIFYAKANELNEGSMHGEFQCERFQGNLLYRMSQCQVKKRDYGAALNSLHMSKDMNSTTLLQIGKLQRKDTGHNAAEKVYSDALKQDELCFEAAVGLTDFLSFPLAFGRVSESSGFSQDSAPLNWLELFVKARYCLSKGEYRDSISHLNMLSDLVCGKQSIIPIIAVNQAICFCCLNEYWKAISLFESVHNVDVGFVDGMDIYAYLLMITRNKLKLRKLAIDLKKYNIHRPEAFTAMALTRLVEESAIPTVSAADDLLTRAKSVHPYHIFTYAILSKLRFDEHELEGARKMAFEGRLRRFAGGGTGGVSVLVNTAQFCMNLLDDTLFNSYILEEDYSEAIIIAQGLKNRNPQSEVPLCYHGTALTKKLNALEDLEKAKQIAEKAHSMNPESERVAILLSDIYCASNEHKKAVDILKEALTRKSDSFDVHMALAGVFEAMEDTTLALEEYNTCAGLNHRSVIVKKAIERLSGANFIQMEEMAEDNVGSDIDSSLDEFL